MKWIVKYRDDASRGYDAWLMHPDDEELYGSSPDDAYEFDGQDLLLAVNSLMRLTLNLPDAESDDPQGGYLVVMPRFEGRTGT